MQLLVKDQKVVLNSLQIFRHGHCCFLMPLPTRLANREWRAWGNDSEILELVCRPTLAPRPAADPG